MADTAAMFAVSMLDLGQGLEIWRVSTSALREQDLNARAMEKEKFDRLTTTIKNDKRLESLPLCAAIESIDAKIEVFIINANGVQETTGKKVTIEIVSGHHRIRAAVAAELTDIWCMVDVTQLDRDGIKAKQLAHNSIQGKDNAQIVSTIFNSIKDASRRLEAFISTTVQVQVPKVKIQDVDVKIEFHSVLVLFMPTERKRFEEAMKHVMRDAKEVWLLEERQWTEFKSIINRVSKEYDVRSMSTILTRMGDIALEAMGEELQDTGYIALRDLLKTSMIPKAAAGKLTAAIKEAVKRGDADAKAPWKLLVKLASAYLGQDEKEGEQE